MPQGIDVLLWLFCFLVGWGAVAMMAKGDW